MTKLEVFQPSLNAKLDGKHVKFEKVEEFCKGVISDITVSHLASGGELDPKDDKLRIAITAIQMIWNEKEELKEKLEKIQSQKTSDEIYDILLDVVPATSEALEVHGKIVNLLKA